MNFLISLKISWFVSGFTISDGDKAEAKITPTKEGELKFKVTITKDQEEFAIKEVTVEVTA